MFFATPDDRPHLEQFLIDPHLEPLLFNSRRIKIVIFENESPNFYGRLFCECLSCSKCKNYLKDFNNNSVKPATTPSTTTIAAARNLKLVDDILRTYQKPSQVAIIIEQSVKQGYLFYLSAENYGEEWKALFDDGFNDTDIEVITHDLRVLLEELEFFAQWMIRDGEDLVHPWVNYTSRELIDAKLFNYTFGAGELIEIVGQTSFRTIKIFEEATLDVNRWIRNWEGVRQGNTTFTFSFVS
ncbi:unnamed protein product, partial [Oikopleura dioica]